MRLLNKRELDLLTVIPKSVFLLMNRIIWSVSYLLKSLVAIGSAVHHKSFIPQAVTYRHALGLFISDKLHFTTYGKSPPNAYSQLKRGNCKEAVNRHRHCSRSPRNAPHPPKRRVHFRSQ
jgi:hypothetical protein